MDHHVGRDALGRWSAGSGPLYKRLADAIRNAVARGDIPADAGLPAERVLAKDLSVSRSTVVSAYDLLAAEGLVIRKEGSGTRVAPQPASTARRLHRDNVWVPRPALRTIVDNPGDVIPFTASTADRLPDGLPRSAFEVDLDDVVSGPPYFEVPEGLPDLRAAVAGMYDDRGLKTSPDQIVVTSGAQQAIVLVAATHLGSGDLALLESPTFPGAIDAFSVVGARARGIPVGPTGADVSAIERSAAQGHLGLMYLIPTFHNPTGALMPSSRRAELAEVVQRWDVPVIDDESLVGLSLGPEPPAPLAAFAPEGRVFSIGSVSKLFWGGLRVGWVRCPPNTVGTILRLKSVSDLSSSLVSQKIALGLLAHRAEMMTLRRRQLLDSLALYTDLLEEHLPRWTFERPSGGLSLWVDTGVDATRLAQAALRHGVAVVTAAETAVDNACSTFVRLPLLLDRDIIRAGVERLAEALEDVDETSPPSVGGRELVV